MQFNEHRLLRSGYESVYRENGLPLPSGSFYPAAKTQARQTGSMRGLAQITIEENWEKLRRPYYLVYPSIIPALCRLNLDLDGSLIRFPLSVLSLRFPANKNPLHFDWEGDRVDIREILFARIVCEDSDESTISWDMMPTATTAAPAGFCTGLSVWVDIGEVSSIPGLGGTVPIQSYRNIRLRDELMIGHELAIMPQHESAVEGIIIPEGTWHDIFRIVLTLCLLEKDKSIIAPDVLNADREKWEATEDDRYVEKAKRRGKVGWRIGHRMEVVPHYRRPHPFKVWTGKGRSELKVVMRSGSIVHRGKVEQLPTGFEGIENGGKDHNSVGH